MCVENRRSKICLFLAFILLCLILYSISIPAIPDGPDSRVNIENLRGACKYQARMALQ